MLARSLAAANSKAGVARVGRPGRRLAGGVHRRGLDREDRQALLDGLELADRLAELHPVVGVGDRGGQGRVQSAGDLSRPEEGAAGEKVDVAGRGLHRRGLEGQHVARLAHWAVAGLDLGVGRSQPQQRSRIAWRRPSRPRRPKARPSDCR
jgi:hypothetical protein